MDYFRRGCLGLWAATLVVGACCGACDSNRSTAAPPATVIPNRIVTIAPNAAETIAALGAADRLVGVSRYCDYPPKLIGLPKVGGLIDPDLEAILRLRPDLVIIRGRIPRLERLCRDRGIPLYRDQTETFDDIFTTITELGALLDKTTEALKLVASLRDRVERIRRAVAGRPRPRVLFTTNREPVSLSRVTTAGKNTFVNSVLTLAGGENVFGKLDVDYPEVGLEDILLERPEVIIEVIPTLDRLSDTMRKQIEDQWRRLGPLPAIRDQRLHILLDSSVVIPSPRVAESVERIARLLHPEVVFDGH